MQNRSVDLTSVGGVIFTESDHKYTNSKGEIYTGITTLLSRYHEKFDTEKTSINKAIKDSVIEYFGLKEYNNLINQNNSQNVIDKIYFETPNYISTNLVNQYIKECSIEEYGENKYLLLEKQVKGYNNLIYKLSSIKNNKPDLYQNILEKVKKECTIFKYGNEKYKALTNKVGGFDNLYTKLNSIKKNKPNLYSLIKDKIDFLQKDWEETNLRAITEGSAEHDKREQQIYSDGGFEWEGVWYEYIEGKNIANVTLDDVIVIPECLVWNHKLKLAGLADIFLFNKGVISVLDYKTNATVDIKPKINNPQFWKYMLGVCSNLLDLNYYHYSLQLKIYQRMAVMLRKDFTMGKNIIIHTSSERYYRDKDSIYETHNVEDIVENIFEELSNQHI